MIDVIAEDGGRAPALPRENVYGSVRRLRWIESHLSAGQRIADLGCGTGYMLTYPLLLADHDVIGVDLDRRSIDYGREVFRSAGLPADRLVAEPLESLEGSFDAVIVSEVLEHQDDAQLSGLLEAVAAKLRPGGALLVTVPNGYGWFELESALWYRLGFGRLLAKLRIESQLNRFRDWLTGGYQDAVHPSSLDGSPHVQRFTRHSIAGRLQQAGFEVESVTGSAMFAGPFSAMLFTGIGPLMRFNTWLAARLPALASGFLVSARLPE